MAYIVIVDVVLINIKTALLWSRLMPTRLDNEIRFRTLNKLSYSVVTSFKGLYRHIIGKNTNPIM